MKKYSRLYFADNKDIKTLVIRLALNYNQN